MAYEGDWEEQEFNKLTGRYKHYCLEYDGLAIDETSHEFQNCLCFTEEERSDPHFNTMKGDQ